MDPFPEPFELVSFFEVEPEVTDRDVPWFYNRHTYRSRLGRDLVTCAMEPGEGQIVLVWDRDDQPVLALRLEEVSELRIESERGVETMIARFPEGRGLLDFRLQLRPSVRVEWGNRGLV